MKKIFSIIALMLMTAAGTMAQTTYTVTVKEGTEDAANWSATPNPATEGQTVTITYTGTKKVKSIKAVKKAAPAPDLSMLDCAGSARDKQWTANCYMVHTAGDYKLPLVYGNAIKNGATNAAAYTGVEDTNATLTFPRHDGQAISAPWIKDNGITVTQAELLWQEAEGLVTAVGISGDYLTLTVGKDATTQEGNAVIAAKTSDGTIVWSWHIWVTTQTFASLTTINTGSHTYQVTPANLGWVTTGGDGKQGTNTYYQWGRKDPFLGTGTVTYVSNSTATIADNIQNPATFYNVSQRPNTATYYNMWDAQQTGTGNVTTATVKTVYDPCPAGFCVPTGNLYYFITNGGSSNDGNWDDTNKGKPLTLGGINLYFPASGLCSNSSGSLGYVGSGGYYWSASATSGSNGRNLGFNSGSWSWSSSRRAYGFPVRAVAEE